MPRAEPDRPRAVILAQATEHISVTQMCAGAASIGRPIEQDCIPVRAHVSRLHCRPPAGVSRIRAWCDSPNVRATSGSERWSVTRPMCSRRALTERARYSAPERLSRQAVPRAHHRVHATQDVPVWQGTGTARGRLHGRFQTIGRHRRHTGGRHRVALQLKAANTVCHDTGASACAPWTSRAPELYSGDSRAAGDTTGVVRYARGPVRAHGGERDVFGSTLRTPTRDDECGPRSTNGRRETLDGGDLRRC
jgi:hypothetical protein